MIEATSRYSRVGTQTSMIDGQTVTFLKRRFLPQPDSLELRSRYRPHPGDRSDRVAAKLLGDPLQYWQLLDANTVPDEQELLRPGTSIRVTWPASAGGGSRG